MAGEIRALIERDGPITVAEFMRLTVERYYARGDPLGVRGDFITAPEISQVFGELLGLWCAETWRQIGAPDRIALVELGPGRGTLMRDALRAAASVPKFRPQLHLVETSPALRALQNDLAAMMARHACDGARKRQRCSSPTSSSMRCLSTSSSMEPSAASVSRLVSWFFFLAGRRVRQRSPEREASWPRWPPYRRAWWREV
jgi:hypothetical protein